MANDWTPPDDPAFVAGMKDGLTAVFVDAAGDAIDQSGLPIDWDWTLPEGVAYGEQRGAELVGKKLVNGVLVDNPNAEWVVDEWTRQRVRELEAQALKEGWSYQQLSDALEESGLFGEARADLIARTELGLAMNRGKTTVYREAGFEYVYVYDQNECGTDLCDVEGIHDLDWFEQNPLGHPNCTRDARPATQDELIEEGILEAEDEQEAA